MISFQNWHYKRNLYDPVIDSYRTKKTGAEISCIIISNKPIEYIDAVFSQVKRNKRTELIFVNNGRKAPVNPDCQLIDKYIILNKDTGAYMARNIGALFAEGKKLWFIDDDGIPDSDNLKEHLSAHKKGYIATTGACYPLSNSPWNYDAWHYSFGRKIAPYFIAMEGNCLISKDIFFKCGGWDDNCRFGGGGYDLTKRMLKINPDFTKYGYVGTAILYHDYCKSLKQAQEKLKMQNKQLNSKILNDKAYLSERDTFKILCNIM